MIGLSCYDTQHSVLLYNTSKLIAYGCVVSVAPLSSAVEKNNEGALLCTVTLLKNLKTNVNLTSACGVVDDSSGHEVP